MGQVVLAATNAACTFVICFLLSDRWPFQHLSTGTLLATNLLLAYASVLLAQRWAGHGWVRRQAVGQEGRARKRDARAWEEAGVGGAVCGSRVVLFWTATCGGWMA